MNKQDVQGKITLYDLYNNQLTEVSIMLEKADTIARILQEVYFGYSQKAVDNDGNIAYQYKNSYDEIQMLIQVIRDNTDNAKNIMEAVFNIDLDDIAN